MTLQPSRKRWRKRMIRRKKSWRWLNPRRKIWLTPLALQTESHRCLRILPPSLCRLSKRSECCRGSQPPRLSGESSGCCSSEFWGTCARLWVSIAAWGVWNARWWLWRWLLRELTLLVFLFHSKTSWRDEAVPWDKWNIFQLLFPSFGDTVYGRTCYSLCGKEPKLGDGGVYSYVMVIFLQSCCAVDCIKMWKTYWRCNLISFISKFFHTHPLDEGYIYSIY